MAFIYLQNLSLHRHLPQVEMPRTGWYRSCIPLDRPFPKIELYRTAVNHDIAVIQPILVPILAVDSHRLYEEAVVRVVQIVGIYAQSLVLANAHGNLGEPRRSE